MSADFDGHPLGSTATACEYMELEGPCNSDLVSLVGLAFSLDSLGCVVLSPSEYLHRIHLWSSPWGSTPGS